MAQQKMHCTLQRNHSNIQEVSDKENCSLSKQSIEKSNIKELLEDREVSSVQWRNSDQRCAFLTFLTIEHDGHWRIVALPVQCLRHSNLSGSREQVNMESAHLVSSPPSSFKVDQQNAQRRKPDAARSLKSYAARTFSGSNVQCHFGNKAFVTKATKTNESSGNPSQNSDFSSFLPSNSCFTNSSDSSIVKKFVKRNSRKKAKKKGKQNKKPASSCVSAELEVFSEECANGSLSSEICAGNDTEFGKGPVLCATSPAVSPTECSVDTSVSEGNSNATVNCSGAQKACPINTREVDVLEAILPSVEQGFSGEHPFYNSVSGIEANGQGFSVFDVVEDTHCKEISCCDDTCSKAFSGMRDSVVLNSAPVGWNSADAGFNLTQDSGDIKPSETPSQKSMKGCFSRQNSSNGFLDPCIHAEGLICGSQGHCSSDIQFSLHGKRGKQVNKVPRNSSAYRINSGGNSLGWKENNHSVWQKVQKSDANRCNCVVEKIDSVSSESDITLKEAPLLNNVVELDVLSNSEDKSYFEVKVSRKLKRKSSLGSKQEFNSGSRKGSHAMKASSNVHTKIDKQRKRSLDIPSLVNDKKTLGCISKHHSQNASSMFELCTDKVECIAPEPNHSLEVHEVNLKPVEKACYTVSSTDAHTRGNQSNSFSKSCDSIQLNLPEAHSQAYLPHLMCHEVAEAEKEVSHAENSKQDHGSASTLHKWIPIGTKDSVLMSMHRSDNSLLATSDETAAGVLTSRNTVEEEPALTYDPSGNAGLTCMSPISTNSFCSPPENEAQIQKFRNQTTCSRIEQTFAANCLSRSMNDTGSSMLGTYSKKIVQAVNDVCRFQLVSEAVQMATGNPVAEFERLLHSASPVICQSDNLRSCQTCSPDQVFGASLCRHEIPNISLGSLWKWYEKHGSYGLEVMAEDYKDTTRLGCDRSSFRAYFVPFLSAVQLFRNRNGNRMGNISGISSPEVLEERTLEPCFLPLKDGISVQEVASIELDDLEPLFEYFEFEQPQRRRPFFEKIKELTRCGPSHCEMYGDPTILASINMHDLHPRSWYAVAWYPIYRIPGDNFRASFLTYHSLGHFVRRSAAGEDACIVSPVVGLQSYNAQSECWFQPRHPEAGHAVETESLNTTEILKERLRTLERTASLMATASVSKGNLTSVNKHPDFEFFISRRR